MKRFLKSFRLAATATAAATVLIMAAPGTGIAADYSDGQLKSFAVAWTSINELAEQWKPQVEGAASREQADQMLKQFEAEASQVIENTDGIGTAEYESIMQAAQSDPALKERIFAMLQEVQPK